MCRNDQRRFDHLANRYERLGGVIADIWMHRGAGGQRAAGRQKDGVAVGIGGRDELCTDTTTGTAAAVLDHNALAEHGAKPIRDDARHTVGRPARRKRHHELDRTVGIGLRLGVPKASALQHPSGAECCGNQDSRDHFGRLPRWVRASAQCQRTRKLPQRAIWGQAARANSIPNPHVPAAQPTTWDAALHRAWTHAPHVRCSVHGVLALEHRIAQAKSPTSGAELPCLASSLRWQSSTSMRFCA